MRSGTSRPPRDLGQSETGIFAFCRFFSRVTPRLITVQSSQYFQSICLLSYKNIGICGAAMSKNVSSLGGIIGAGVIILSIIWMGLCIFVPSLLPSTLPVTLVWLITIIAFIADGIVI